MVTHGQRLLWSHKNVGPCIFIVLESSNSISSLTHALALLVVRSSRGSRFIPLKTLEAWYRHQLQEGDHETNAGLPGFNQQYIVGQFIGHTPQTVAERYYFGDKKGRMVEVFREHVAEKIDGLLERIEGAKWHKMAQPISVVPFLRGLSRS